MEAPRGDAGLSADARYFDPAGFRDWLEEYHESETEVWVGYYKKASGRRAMSWSEAVDQALCFGWIDGVARSIDDERYVQRFTPRRKGSNWSKVNVEKVARLEAQGLMTPAGRRAFEAREEARTGVYSFEQDEEAELPPEYAQRLREDAAAAEFFAAQAPWYRRTATHWVVSAKREETRERRLAALIEDSARGRRLGQFDRRAAS